MFPSSLYLKSGIIRSITSGERDGKPHSSTLSALGIQTMIDQKLFCENVLHLNSREVLCSEWISSEKIIFGTKCNKLFVYNVVNNEFTPMTNFNNGSCQVHNGVSAIATNLTKTVVGVGGPCEGQISFYDLSSFNMFCLGSNEQAFTSDMKWIDHEVLISSADNMIKLWHVNPRDLVQHPSAHCTIVPFIEKPCKLVDVIRNLHIKSRTKMTVLSSNGYVHDWDISCFKHLTSHKLPYVDGISGLAYNNEYDVYAIGSHSSITFVDGKNFNIVRAFITNHERSNILSMCFKNNILSMSTGYGKVHFYDLVSGKFKENCLFASCIRPQSEPITLAAYDVCPIIYTHCYDSSGTRLFTAGGASLLDFQGNYVALWQ